MITNLMLFRINKEWLFLLLLVICTACFSDSLTTLNFKYSIVAAPCDVVVNDGGDTIAVHLGDIPVAKLISPGDVSDWKTFSIMLKNCPETTAQYHAKFSGTPATDPTVYYNAGSATHVQVELQSQAGDILDNGSTLNGDIINSAAQLDLRARAVTRDGGATGGGIQSSIQLTFTYS